MAIALLHHPVLDREGRVVTTSITNLDLHDIARSAHTYALEAFYVTHPVTAQRELALRVREHWTTGSGARRIPDRRLAMQILNVVTSLDEAVASFAPSQPLELWTTGASAHGEVMSYRDARARLMHAGPPVLLVFGTGWGLAEEVCTRTTRRLEPIRSMRPDGYNHLSVRAAAAITFDRLLANS